MLISNLCMTTEKINKTKKQNKKITATRIYTVIKIFTHSYFSIFFIFFFNFELFFIPSSCCCCSRELNGQRRKDNGDGLCILQ